MEIHKNTIISAVMFLSALIMLQHCCEGQNSPQDYLDVHNAARSEVGVGPMTWDSDLADYAQNYVNQRIDDCNLVHSKGPYGENLAKGSGDFSGRAAAELWVGEKRDYDYTTNSCTAGWVCGHYTQVVWESSVRLGCARVGCSDGWWFVSCNYDPPGNFVGRRPYGTDASLRTQCYFGNTNIII